MSIRNAIEPVPAAHDLVHDFAAFVAVARYEDVPAPAREAAKKSILDTLGVIIAASGADARVGAFVDVACEAGGAAESTVLGFGRRAPALQAAFANGVLAHRLDFDDVGHGRVGVRHGEPADVEGQPPKSRGQTAHIDPGAVGGRAELFDGDF